MFIELDGKRVYYEVHGPDRGPAVLFTHGVAMDHRTFDEQVSALADRYRVIVWDMPGHGRSDPIDRHKPFSNTAAEITVRLLDEASVDRATLAGLSLGSLVNQYVLANAPERVAGMIHISGGSLSPGYPRVLKILIPFVSFGMALYPQAALNKAFADHKALTASTRQYLKETIAATGKPMVTHLVNEMIRDMAAGLPEPPDRPTLILYGDHDIGFIRRMSETWHTRLPESRLVRVDQAHHILNQDNAEACNMAIAEFLANAEVWQATEVRREE